MNWLSFTIGSVISFTTLNLFQRKSAIKSKYPRATSAVFNLWASLLVIIIFLITRSYQNSNLFHQPSIAYFFLIIACLGYGLFERGRFLVAKLLDASTMAILSNFSTIIAFILSVLLYAEHPSTLKLIGSTLTIIALFLVSTNSNRHQSLSFKSVVIPLLFFFFLAIAWSLDKKGTSYFDPNTYQIFVWVIPLIVIYFPGIKKSELIYEVKAGSWKTPIAATANVIGYFFQLKAFQLTEATTIIPIIQLSTILTVILSIFLLKEEENKTKKIVAAILATVGASLIATS